MQPIVRCNSTHKSTINLHTRFDQTHQLGQTFFCFQKGIINKNLQILKNEKIFHINHTDKSQKALAKMIQTWYHIVV